MKFAAFDIETSLSHELICGGIMLYSDKDILSEYFWFQNNENPAREMIDRLSSLREKGYTIVGFNSTFFDWRVLARDSGEYEVSETLALDSVDLMLEFFFRMGYMISLNNILSRYSITQKRKKSIGKNGEYVEVGGPNVGQLWEEKEYNVVLDYLSDDIRATLELAEAIHADDKILYRTSSGKEKELHLNGGLRKAIELWKIPEPDTSWIKNGVKRDHFFSWINITTDITISAKWYWKESPLDNQIVWGKFRAKGQKNYAWPVYIIENVWYSLDGIVLSDEPIAWAYIQMRPK